MPQTTRDQMLEAATALFAERGFYGVSIAQIADEVGLTKQALLHHFSTKEKLYGEVLQRISEGFETLLADARAVSSDPSEQLRHYLVSMLAVSQGDVIRSRILMRELLDNKRRASTAGVWYLKPFLENLVEMARETPAGTGKAEAEVLALVYQLLGALNYYAVSGPTLIGIFGDDRYAALDATFAQQFERLLDQALSA